MILDSYGMGIEIKKGWLKVEGGEYALDDDGLYLRIPDLPTVKSKETVGIVAPHIIKLHGRYSCHIHYNPELYSLGQVMGPPFLNGNGGRIFLKFKADTNFDLKDLGWIVKLEVLKI